MKEFATDDTPACALGRHDVGCTDPTKCDRCGWNDEVARERLARMYGYIQPRGDINECCNNGI